MDIQELLRRKKSEMAAKKTSGLKPIKPESGKHLYRILPSWRKPKLDDDGVETDESKKARMQFWHDFGQHFVKAEKGGKPAVFICNEHTFGQACDVCSAIGTAIGRCNDDETLKLLKDANSSQKFLLNVLHLSSTDEAKRKVPQLMEVGSTVFNGILDIGEEYDDITSLEAGLDLIIKKEGSGMDTEYSVLPSSKGARKIDASVMANVVDIDAYVSNANETRKAQALSNLSTASGLLAAPVDDKPVVRAASTLRSATESVVDDAEFEEMPDFLDEEPVVETPKATPKATAKATAKPTPTPSADDLDDLDAILADLG